ncbi:MAG: ABC transporter ATP-binding protein [Ruminococcaceae bacterium]|nr:ABC transporter ATP-binding protein [Oscillospiraceae bacterium]
MDILRISNLQKSFGDKNVLDGLDLTVSEKSIFGFIGKNGAGKTTTMKIVLGLMKADAGDIFVADRRVCYGQTPTNKLIGYLPDVPEFYSFMTAREYLTLCGESLEMPKKEINERSSELLTLVGLSEENHRIKGYSRGMKQRLGIAQALLHRPKLLICDEPTSALDPVGRKELLDILVAAKEETTVLFSTHILSDVERICTNVAFLNEGKIAMQGTVENLKSIKRSEEFLIEAAAPEGAKLIAEKFGSAQIKENNSIILSGDEKRVFEILSFISCEKIPVNKFEKIEPSLESLFMEVISK